MGGQSGYSSHLTIFCSNLDFLSVNCNNFCTQNAKVFAFWRRILTILMDECTVTIECT